MNPFRRDCDLQGEPHFFEVLLAARFVACLAASRDHKALPRKWRFMKLDCSQPLAIAKACNAAGGFFSM